MTIFTSSSALVFAAATLAAVFQTASAFSGDATFYGGAGNKGACSQNYVPPGFKTVAINNAQYDGGLVCGSCVEGCFDMNGKKECFKAIVDNECPECGWGSLDMGWGGDGRWKLEWNFIDCPASDPIFSSQGSNQWYGKLKIEGGGPIASVQVDGKNANPTPDGFWVIDDGSGKLGCGPKVNVMFSNGKSIEKCIPGSLFGGSCPGGQSCISASITNPAPWINNAPKPQPENQGPTNVAGAQCQNGILHSDGKACCPKSCTKCGGAQCSNLPGGSDQCCASRIILNHKGSCATNAAPCTMP